MTDEKGWPDFGSDNRDELFDFAESLEQRAEAAEARVKELESDTEFRFMRDQLAACSVRVKELEAEVEYIRACMIGSEINAYDEARRLRPPPGHINVPLPREDVEFLAACARYKREDTPRFRTYEACRKALEADDA